MQSKHLFLLAFALSLVLLAAEPAVRLALVVQFPSTVTPETRRAMEAEIRRSIPIESMGIVWREAAATGPEEWYDRVVSIRVRGNCDASAGMRRTPLGTTHVCDGRVLPFIDIDSDRIAAMLRSDLAPLGPYAWEPTMGQALGRVAAHELFHVLANTQEHGRQGLAKPQFTRADLLMGKSVRMDPQDLQRMRFELHRPIVIAAGGY